MSSPSSGRPVALVVGGTKGLGRATSIRLALDGFAVFACSRSQADVDSLAGAASERGLPIGGAVCDAGDEAALHAWIDGALDRYGRIDSLVFAAGTPFTGSSIDLSLDAWDACFNINLRAPFVAAKRVLPAMAAAGNGTLVFVSSIWAFTTARRRVAYGVAKSALTALVRGIAVDHAHCGIRANAVAPGYVENDLIRRSISAVHGEEDVERVLTSVRAAHPSRRLVTPEEVAATIGFLAGPHSSGVNGQTLIVDGGSTIRFALADMWQRDDGPSG